MNINCNKSCYYRNDDCWAGDTGTDTPDDTLGDRYSGWYPRGQRLRVIPSGTDTPGDTVGDRYSGWYHWWQILRVISSGTYTPGDILGDIYSWGYHRGQILTYTCIMLLIKNSSMLMISDSENLLVESEWFFFTK